MLRNVQKRHKKRALAQEIAEAAVVVQKKIINRTHGTFLSVGAVLLFLVAKGFLV